MKFIEEYLKSSYEVHGKHLYIKNNINFLQPFSMKTIPQTLCVRTIVQFYYINIFLFNYLLDIKK